MAIVVEMAVEGEAEEEVGEAGAESPHSRSPCAA